MKTTSLELSKQLKEAGYPQDNVYFYWTDGSEEGARPMVLPRDWEIITTDMSQRWELRDEARSGNKHWYPIFASPSAEEILERLPAKLYIAEFKKSYIMYVWRQPDGKYGVFYRIADEYYGSEIKGENLAEAAGKMWLYLKEQGLLKDSEVREG